MLSLRFPLRLSLFLTVFSLLSAPVWADEAALEPGFTAQGSKGKKGGQPPRPRPKPGPQEGGDDE